MRLSEAESLPYPNKTPQFPQEVLTPTSDNRGLKGGIIKTQLPSTYSAYETFPLLGFYEESHSTQDDNLDDGIFLAKWNENSRAYDTEKYADTFLHDKMPKEELDTVMQSLLPCKEGSLGKILDTLTYSILITLVTSAILIIVLHLCSIIEQKSTTAILLFIFVMVMLLMVIYKVKKANDFLISWNQVLENRISSANSSLLNAKDISVVKSRFGFFIMFQFHSEMLPEPAYSNFTRAVKDFAQAAEPSLHELSIPNRESRERNDRLLDCQLQLDRANSEIAGLSTPSPDTEAEEACNPADLP
jgi:hypothetical protein